MNLTLIFDDFNELREKLIQKTNWITLRFHKLLFIKKIKQNILVYFINNFENRITPDHLNFASNYIDYAYSEKIDCIQFIAKLTFIV